MQGAVHRVLQYHFDVIVASTLAKETNDVVMIQLGRPFDLVLKVLPKLNSKIIVENLYDCFVQNENQSLIFQRGWGGVGKFNEPTSRCRPHSPGRSKIVAFNCTTSLTGNLKLWWGRVVHLIVAFEKLTPKQN